MDPFLKEIWPILPVAVIFIWWLASWLNNTFGIVGTAKYKDFFVPIIGGSLKINTLISRYYHYEAKGWFQDRKAFIATKGHSLLTQGIVLDIAVMLNNYKINPLQHLLRGVPFQHDDKEYLLGGKFFVPYYDKLTRRIKIKNFDDEARILIQKELQDLCGLAERIDKGELKYDFLSGK